MVVVISAMFAGICVGYLLRRHRLGLLPRIIMGFILLLLFLLGFDIGSDEHIIKSIPTLGAEALLISLLSILFSCIAAWILWRICGKPHANSKEDNDEG